MSLLPLENTNCKMEKFMLEHESVLWLLHRKMLVCSSEIGGLLGLDESRSRKKIMMSKCMNAPLLESTNNEYVHRMMYWGSVQEQVALQYLQNVSRYPLVSLGRLRYNDLCYFEGTPDAVTIDPVTEGMIPVEVKTRAWPDVINAEPFQTKFDVPYKHWVQLMCYMILLAAKRGILVSHSANRGTKIYELAYNVPFAIDCILPCIKSYVEGTLSITVSRQERLSVLMLIENVVKTCVKEINRI